MPSASKTEAKAGSAKEVEFQQLHGLEVWQRCGSAARAHCRVAAQSEGGRSAPSCVPAVELCNLGCRASVLRSSRRRLSMALLLAGKRQIIRSAQVGHLQPRSGRTHFSMLFRGRQLFGQAQAGTGKHS